MSLTGRHLDILTELINIGVGRAAGVLNDMLHSPVELRVPMLQALSPADLRTHYSPESESKLASVQLGFKGAFSGRSLLVFPEDSISRLVALVREGEAGSLDIDEARLGTLSEVGNIILNGVMGSIANLLHEAVHYSLPEYSEDSAARIFQAEGVDNYAVVVYARAHFKLTEHDIEFEILILMGTKSLGALEACLEALEGESYAQSQ